MILFVRLEVLRQLRNPLAEERHLHLWRARVVLVDPELRYNLLLFNTRQRHSEMETSRLSLI